MGWEAGLLSGFLGRKGEVEAENRRAAELSSQRESDVYRALLGEGVNPEIQAMALAGMLESAQPKKKKGGFKGWLGEMETSPTFQRLQQFLTTPQVEERETLASSRRGRTPVAHASSLAFTRALKVSSNCGLTLMSPRVTWISSIRALEAQSSGRAWTGELLDMLTQPERQAAQMTSAKRANLVMA